MLIICPARRFLPHPYISFDFSYFLLSAFRVAAIGVVALVSSNIVLHFFLSFFLLMAANPVGFKLPIPHTRQGCNPSAVETSWQESLFLCSLLREKSNPAHIGDNSLGGTLMRANLIMMATCVHSNTSYHLLSTGLGR